MTTNKSISLFEAPDFTLTDTHDNAVTLSDLKGHKNVVLVFNRGFM
ncbi:MAG: redoxin domain-containing protein [Chloroflexi bacterium]|nr:redoxin domain-containing protein [Chloroflexota bacterium]